MTRGEFMGKMLESIFGTKYIQFNRIENSVVRYTKGGDFYKDCSYSYTYKEHFLEIFQKLFDSECSEILVKERKYSAPKPILEYHKKAIDFIFSLKGFNYLGSDTIDALKRNMTIQMISRIYLEIILETIFDIGNQHIGQERGDDDFNKSVDKIFNLILEFIKNELPELLEKEHKNAFFRELVKTYPLFSELHLEEDNKIVQIHLEREEKQVQLTFGYVSGDLFSRMDLIEEYLKDNNELVVFIAKDTIYEDDFLDLDFKLDTLLVNVQSYRSLFSKDKVIEFKNTAISLYNRLYGKGHPEYKDVTFLAAWNAHVKYVDYLFSLAHILDSYHEE
ncbi:MAG: hypothetical protein E7496_06435 [Ruminococcus sp.]|nr:hypothetical protein [Ruminococcus sp.]